jgi:HSP20 family protein
MAIQRRRPEQGLTAWEPMKAMERYFEDVFGRPFLPAAWGRLPEDVSWMPTMDVIEKADKFVVKVELPGVTEEDINISVAGNILTIEGEKETASEEDKKDYYYSESSYGSFSRSMTIPSTVDASKIEASCDKGICEIVLPKTSEIKSKKVPVAAKKKAAASAKKEPAVKKK